MLWDKWIPKKYLVKSEICSVEVVFSDNETTFYYTHLKNKSYKLNLVATWSSSNTLEFPKLIEKNKIPVVIIANGKGIVLKKITLSENAEQNFESLIHANLPTINTNDFFVQLYRQTNSTAFIALCRKEQVKLLINEIQSKKIEVVNVLIGAASVGGLKPLWSNFNTLATTLHAIELSDNVIENIVATPTNNNSTLKIEDISFDARHTLGFAGGISYLTQKKLSQTDAVELLELETKHLEKNKLRMFLIGVIAIAFIIAISNVFCYTHYFDKNNKLETELAIYQGKYEQINQLLEDYQQKKGLIENAGILTKNKLSEYADKIGSTVPTEVVLSELYFNPKNEEEECEDSLTTFHTKQLILRGNCNKSMIINEWVNVLKMQKFVKDVSLEKFSYNSEGILPNFEIKLITQ